MPYLDYLPYFLLHELHFFGEKYLQNSPFALKPDDACVTSGFRRGVCDIFALLGCYTA
jgi:hypothetical protein